MRAYQIPKSGGGIDSLAKADIPEPKPGHRQVKVKVAACSINFRDLGIVRGITVRSRSIFGTLGGTFQTIVGGNITAFTKLCEHARGEAFDIMIQHASEIGANAIIGMRYDANEIMNGVTEVLAYGTAVIMEPIGE